MAGGGVVTALIGFDGVDGSGCVADFGAGTCGLACGDCRPGVIAVEGVAGVEGFAADVGCGGVIGLALSPGAADGTTEPTAAEGTAVDGFAAGICDGDVLRLVCRAGVGVDVPAVIAAEGVGAGVCEEVVPGLAPPAGVDDGVAGAVAVDGDVGATAFAAGACDGVDDGLLGAIAADGVVGDGVLVVDGRG
jgi:hypothetical protein